MALFTPVRAAVWTALTGDTEISATFGGRIVKYDSDDETRNRTSPIPDVADMPQLGIWPAGLSASLWETHRSHLVGYNLGFEMYTKDWVLPTAEDLWEKIVRRIWDQKAAIKTAGGKVVIQGPVEFIRATAGRDGTGPKALLTKFSFTFRIGFLPFTT